MVKLHASGEGQVGNSVLVVGDAPGGHLLSGIGGIGLISSAGLTKVVDRASNA